MWNRMPCFDVVSILILTSTDKKKRAIKKFHVLLYYTYDSEARGMCAMKSEHINTLLVSRDVTHSWLRRASLLYFRNDFRGSGSPKAFTAFGILIFVFDIEVLGPIGLFTLVRSSIVVCFKGVSISESISLSRGMFLYIE